MSGGRSQSTSSAGGTLLSWLREIAIVVVGALIASTLLRLFVLQMFVIPSVSMENTLLVGDRVAVQKVIPFHRGDVVVFRDSLGWLGAPPPEEDALHQALIFVGLAPDESANHLIKRVIGVAGDHVTCCDAQGRVAVNGVALNETAYLYTDPATKKQVEPSSYTFDVIVPAGTVFVMGDHRDRSQDSRCHIWEQVPGKPEGYAAFIPVTDIVGPAVAVVYPFSRFHGLDQTTFANIPSPGAAPAHAVIKGPEFRC